MKEKSLLNIQRLKTRANVQLLKKPTGKKVSKPQQRDLKACSGRRWGDTYTHIAEWKILRSPGSNFLSERVFVCGCLACQTLPPPPPPPPSPPPPLSPARRAGTSSAVKTSAHVNSPPWVRPEWESAAPKKEKTGGGREEKEKESPFKKVCSFMVTPLFFLKNQKEFFSSRGSKAFSNASSPLLVSPSFLLSGREKVKTPALDNWNVTAGESERERMRCRGRETDAGTWSVHLHSPHCVCVWVSSQR